MNQENLSKKYIIWQPLLLASMVALGMIIGFKLNDKTDAPMITKVPNGSNVSIGRVEEILRFVEAKYVDTVDNELLVHSAIQAILDQLDPHSVYLPPNAVKEENETLNGSFRGIGIESMAIDDTVNIITVLAGGPAYKGGLKQFDQIIAIDDTMVAGKKKSFEYVRSMLRKPNKKSVKIEIKRQGQNLIKIVNIDDVALHSANHGRMIDNEIGLIRIEQFSSNTYTEFMETLENLVEKNGMKHLVIDLRGNPGGYLPQATKILNQLFKEKDRLLMFTKGKEKDHITEYKSTGKTFFDIKDVYVLVDENSASGSEIIAGVLQDWDRATIIGRRTFGKGLVQEQYNLSNGGAVRLTTAKYFLATGRSIQRSYKNNADYYNDLEQRLDKGQLFKEDTSRIQNNKVFKTLVKDRKVYEGQGIDPDIFVAADSASYSRTYHSVVSFIREYVFRNVKSQKLTIAQIKDSKAIQKELENVIAYSQTATSNKLPVLTSQEKVQLRKALESEFYYVINNGDTSIRHSHHDATDNFIQAVLKAHKK